MAVLHHKSPTTPIIAATIPLCPKDTALASPVKGMMLVEPAVVPAVVEAEIETLVGVVWGGVDVVVRTATVEEDEDVTDVASNEIVGASFTDVGVGVWYDDVAGVEALYATVPPAMKPSGSVTLCRVAQVLGSTPYKYC